MSVQNSIEKGLPTNIDAERFVLGSILLDENFYVQAAGTLEADDFSSKSTGASSSEWANFRTAEKNRSRYGGE